MRRSDDATAPRRRGEAGMSLVEVLVAFFLLLVISLSVLEMFTLAYAVNMGSEARTDLTYRAQRVGEAIRWIYSLQDANPTLFDTAKANSGVDLAALTPGTKVTLPTSPAATTWAFWGPAGINVVEEDARFVLHYTVQPGGAAGRWRVVVGADPRGEGRRYLGSVSAAKAVRYVAVIP
ncbi:MAG: prepilin-type N-terminal cleavage/methylation domain-containing protein [Acidobacteriota bacterium]|jgi:type II secretory pathway pseudopilin PulG